MTYLFMLSSATSVERSLHTVTVAVGTVNRKLAQRLR